MASLAQTAVLLARLEGDIDLALLALRAEEYARADQSLARALSTLRQLRDL